MSMYYSALAHELIEKNTAPGQSGSIRYIVNQHNGELLALRYLKLHGDQSLPKDISESMLVSSARMAALLKHMECKGWISRSDDPENGRQTIVSLLPTGKEHLEESEKNITEYVTSLLEAMGPDDAAEYVRLQKKLMNIISNRKRS